MAVVALMLLAALVLQWQTARSGRLRIVADRLAPESSPAEDVDRHVDVGPASHQTMSSARAEEVPRRAAASHDQDVESAPDSAPAASSENPADLVQSKPQRVHGWGSPTSKAQVELFFNYHAADGPALNQILAEVVARHPGEVAVAVRHLPPFPVCSECSAAEHADHPIGTCRAARAAEAAGALRGSTGFQRMHDWLAARRGRFDDAELGEFLAEIGLDDVASFQAVMNSKSVRENLLADSVEARVRGVSQVPAVVINGGSVESGVAVAAFKQRLLDALQATELPLNHITTLQAPEYSESLQQRAILATIRIKNPTQSLEGSGVVVGQRDGFAYALTADHVVVGSPTVEVETFSIGSYPRPREVYRAATVVLQSSRDDLALVRFASSGPLTSLSICPRGEMHGLIRNSAPAGAETLTVGCSQGQAPTPRLDRILGQEWIRRPNAEQAVQVWRLRGPNAAGRSGGALVGPTGCLLGIASGMGEGATYYSHLFTTRDFLARSSYKWILEQ